MIFQEVVNASPGYRFSSGSNSTVRRIADIFTRTICINRFGIYDVAQTGIFTLTDVATDPFTVKKTNRHRPVPAKHKADRHHRDRIGHDGVLRDKACRGFINSSDGYMVNKFSLVRHRYPPILDSRSRPCAFAVSLAVS
jgi:hypothetical protein